MSSHKKNSHSCRKTPKTVMNRMILSERSVPPPPPPLPPTKLSRTWRCSPLPKNVATTATDDAATDDATAAATAVESRSDDAADEAADATAAVPATYGKSNNDICAASATTSGCHSISTTKSTRWRRDPQQQFYCDYW
jgi:hypothetical protein